MTAALMTVRTVPAQDPAVKGREVFNRYQNCVVTVQLVIKSKLGVPGLGGEGGESKEEITGTVIDPGGLAAVCLTSTDPGSLLRSFMVGMGGGDTEDSLKFKFESELSDIKILQHDGTEVPAEIVLRDRDLDLAFVRPKAKLSAPVPFIDLSQSGKVDILESVVAINRLGRVAGRTPAVSLERVEAIVRKPRLFYVCGGDKTSTGLGSPAFAMDGKVVGLFVMRSLKSGGGGGLGMFSTQSAPFTAILLPAEDVRKVAAQVPAAKEEKSP